jgi:hypothetical protein
MTDAISGLLGSRKAVMVLIVFLVLSGLVYAGRIPTEFLKQFLEIVMPTWLVAHAGEQGARALAASKQSGSNGDDEEFERDHGVASPT